MEPCDINARKAALRDKMRALRKSTPKEERDTIDKVICSKVLALPEFRDSEEVFAYLSVATEVETRGIINAAWDAGKKVALPKCVRPRQMRWYCVSDFDNLVKGSLGIEEPHAISKNEMFPDACKRSIALVPGLAFDDDGFRLGYGGGYYDAFLSNYPGVSVGLCRLAHRVQSLSNLEVIDSFDLPVDIVVSA